MARFGPNSDHWEIRLWRSINKLGPDDCWDWQAGITCRGYGCISIKKKTFSSHRMAWISTNGPIPESDSYHGICVLHKCDNRKCCNPNHLFLGTAKDNNQDRERKKRGNHRFGTKHWNAKLNNETVCEIRSLIGTMSMIKIGEKFGVSHSTISNINNNKYWVAV